MIERCGTRAGRHGAIVLATLVLAGPALVTALWPEAAEWAAYDRARIAAGEVWRAATGHWTHWTAEHLLWDLVAFSVLLPLCLALGTRRTLVTLALAVVAIPLLVWHALPDMTAYRGLSGLDSALFTLCSGTLLLYELRARAWGGAATFGAALVAFAVKVGFEVASGGAVFVSGGGFVPVPLAHVAGGASGLLVALLAPPRPDPARIDEDASTHGHPVHACTAGHRPAR